MLMTKEELQRLKVTQLKDRCREAGFKVSGTKAQLIERLLERQTSRDEKRSSHTTSTEPQTTKKRAPSTSRVSATKYQKTIDGASAAGSKSRAKKQTADSFIKQGKVSHDTKSSKTSSPAQSGNQSIETIKAVSFVPLSKSHFHEKKELISTKPASAISATSLNKPQLIVDEPTTLAKPTLKLTDAADRVRLPATIDSHIQAKGLTSKPSHNTKRTAKLNLQINRSSLKEADVNLVKESKQLVQSSDKTSVEHSINLPTIQRPPKACHRRMVEGLSIALAWGGRESIRLALCINREWYYAAHLAWRQLCEHCFGGTRLNCVKSRNDPSTCNYYPYFSARKEEYLQNKAPMENSWMARFYHSIDKDIYTAIHPCLLWCPDDARQLRIALRFCMTRVIHMIALFQNQIEGGGLLSHFPRVMNIVLIGRNVCQIEMEDSTKVKILEATGEVIGSDQALDLSKKGIVRVRQDWDHFLRQHDPRPLIEHVFTLDTDYPHGIHKALPPSSLEYEIAARFVLANVDPECISGGSDVSKMRMKLTPKFCVESVVLPGERFGSRRLFNDFALVQTSERGYFVIAEVGLAVGSDDEGGLEGIWERILGSPYEVAQASSHIS